MWVREGERQGGRSLVGEQEVRAGPATLSEALFAGLLLMNRFFASAEVTDLCVVHTML